MVIAVTGQLSAACLQSQESQPVGSATHALSSLSSKTLGQSSEQSPHPIQVSISIIGVAITMTPFLLMPSFKGNEDSSFLAILYASSQKTSMI
jgi:hypothetical protein